MTPPTDHFPNRMWDVMTTLGVVFDGWVPISPSGRIDVLNTSGITQFTHRFGARCCYQYIDCAEDAETIVRSLRKVFSDKPSAEIGTKDDPWTCGDGVTAYLDNGVLVIEGRGVLASQPWEAKKDAIVDIRMDETVSGLTPRMMNVLPRLRAVSGIRLDVFNQVAAGAVTAGFKKIAIDSETKTVELTLSIRTAETLDAPESEWTETKSVSVDVPAKGPVGYYIVK